LPDVPIDCAIPFSLAWICFFCFSPQRLIEVASWAPPRFQDVFLIGEGGGGGGGWC